jgi:hypothetical protein
VVGSKATSSDELGGLAFWEEDSESISAIGWRHSMKATALMVVGLMMVFAFLAVCNSGSVLAQQNPNSGQSAEKLPPDIHPETLSRATRLKKDDFTTDEEKQAYEHVMGERPKLSVSRWLGPTGTRLRIPEVAEIDHRELTMLLQKSGVDPKYLELTIAVATRETDNRDEFLNHEPDAIKVLGTKVEDIVRLRQDPKGLEEKEVAIIQFGRELFHEPIVSSKAFADLERNFGKKGALGITLIMCHYDSNALLMRAYDQHMDKRAECVTPHSGCVNPAQPLPSW